MSVDVVIPVRNGEPFIAECLESIYQQTRSDFIGRILVINDGSTDKTAEVVKSFERKLPNLELFNINPSGLSAARNYGLSVASATNIAFLDSDDLWLARKIEFHADHLVSHPNCKFSFTMSLEFQSGSNDARQQGRNLATASFDSILLQDYRIYGSGSSVFANREFLVSSGGFKTSITFGEDWDLWLKLASKHLPCEISDPGTLIRVHPASMQRTKKIGDDRFSNSSIHFREWEEYPSIFAHPDFQSRAVRVLWAEFKRNLSFKFFFSNDLRNFHRANHEIVMSRMGLDRKHFFKLRLFALKVFDYLTARFK
jgi:glycosyltransferase involved in cell wall biosynthesis